VNKKIFEVKEVILKVEVVYSLKLLGSKLILNPQKDDK